MAAGAIVIVIKSRNRVKEEQSAKVSEPGVQMTSESLFQSGLNPAGKTLLLKNCYQLIIQPRVGLGRLRDIGRAGNSDQQPTKTEGDAPGQWL